MKFCDGRRVPHAFGLVNCQQDSLPRFAQQLRDFVIVSIDTCPGINEEDDDVSFSNGLVGLASHFTQDTVLGNRLETTRIDRNERVSAHPPLAVVTIPSQSGKIGDQSRPRTRDAVKQGRFADVGSTYERNHRLETGFTQFTPTKTRLPLPVCTSTPSGVPSSGESTAPPPTLRRPKSSPSRRDRKCT